MALSEARSETKSETAKGYEARTEATKVLKARSEAAKGS